MNLKESAKCPGCNTERSLNFFGLEITMRWIEFKLFCNKCNKLFTVTIRNVTVFDESKRNKGDKNK